MWCYTFCIVISHLDLILIYIFLLPRTPIPTGRELALNWQGTGRIRALKAINCTPANNTETSPNVPFYLVNRTVYLLYSINKPDA